MDEMPASLFRGRKKIVLHAIQCMHSESDW